MSNKGIPLRFLGDLERIEYHEGDVFVLYVTTFMRVEAQDALRKHWEIVMPGSKLMILEASTKLALLSKVINEHPSGTEQANK